MGATVSYELTDQQVEHKCHENLKVLDVENCDNLTFLLKVVEKGGNLVTKGFLGRSTTYKYGQWCTIDDRADDDDNDDNDNKNHDDNDHHDNANDENNDDHRLGAGRISWGEGFLDPSDVERGLHQDKHHHHHHRHYHEHHHCQNSEGIYIRISESRREFRK